MSPPVLDCKKVYEEPHKTPETIANGKLFVK
jgi:hypothetical protein